LRGMTTELKNKISLLNSFIDESFDQKNVTNYKLLIQIGNDGLVAAVLDKIKNKFIAFEYFGFMSAFDSEVIAGLLEIVLKESAIIDLKYPSVACVVVNNLSTLVPSALFAEEDKKKYLDFNVQLKGNEVIMDDDLKNQDAKNIFALPLIIKTKFDSLYKSVSYHHFSSGIIENVLAQNKNQTKKKLFVHVQPTHFEIIVIEGKKLLFYNTFQHHSPEDFIYYLLFACEQLHLNPENIETVLIGEIERNSGIYSLTQKYIRNLNFGERTDDFDFSYQLQTFPKHFYFSLFNNYLL
jgi:hypothetical protein